MKLLYKPFSIITGIVAARLGRALFKGIWSRVDQREPPKATAPEASLTKVVGAAALEAATMASVSAAADRAAAETFHYLTGVWPDKSAGEQTEK
jgi:Protein of unknown function (DUF4235)